MDVFDLAGPAILFFMMALVGSELSVEDFRRVARYPRAVVVGTAAQLVLLPLCTAALVLLFEPQPFVAAGMVLLAATPGGGISNVFTYLAGANTALSVTLTAVSSLLAALTLPVVTSLGFVHLVGAEAAFEVPVPAMIGQLAGLIGLPIGLGMTLRARRPDLPERWGPNLRRAVLASVVLLFAAGMGGDDTGLAGEVLEAAPLGLLWTALTLGFGLVTGALLGLDGADRFTFGIEFSVRNVGLAAIVAISSFDEPAYAVFSGAYAMTGYPLAIVACFAFRRVRGGGGGEGSRADPR